MNLLEVINGNNEWIERLKTDENLSDLITWFEMSNETLEHYDDVIRESRNKLSQLTKLP